MIAVTGATGALGGRVAERLAATGDVPLRLVVRDAGRAPRTCRAPRSSRTPAATPTAPGSGPRWTGVDTLYLVSAAEAEDRLQQHLDRRRRRGRRRRAADRLHVVPRRDARRRVHPRAPARRHRGGASAPPASGTRSCGTTCTPTSCRSSPTVEDDRAVIAAPAGEGRTASSPATTWPTSPPPSCCDDDDRLDGQALEVTGPEALTLAEAAGRAHRGHRRSRPSTATQTVEEAWATRRPSGHPDWEIEGWVTSYLAIAAGELSTGHRRRPAADRAPGPHRGRAPARATPRTGRTSARRPIRSPWPRRSVPRRPAGPRAAPTSRDAS